ncbi:MAG TPA: MOSC domain-containing protein [Vicinamibacteria bacterium]|jgi:MOSC domain-containing protein YiiM
MRLLSINVGGPREVVAQRKIVRTSIFKDPVSGPVRVGKLNLEGDAQSDLSVHGGVDKAVYAYPSEHYPYWREQLPDAELPWGAFGENLTTEGLNEKTVRIGDRLNVGSAAFVVRQPRLPCFKLGIRFGREDMVRRFLKSGRTGFYLAVIQEGEIAAGDAIEWFPTNDPSITVSDVARLYTDEHPEPKLLRQASELAALSEGWREHFRDRLSESASRFEPA